MFRLTLFDRYPAALPAQPANIRWTLLLVLLLAVIPYLRVIGYPFINLDDQLYVTQNYRVQSGLSLRTAAWALKATEPTNWHPLTLLSHALDCTLFGVYPAGHHATNLLFHAINSVLVFLLLFKASGSRRQALLVAALFAVHPLNVETVAWVASRKGLLSSFFALLALIAYVRYAQAPSLKRYLPILVLAVLALAAKPMVVTLPFLMLLLDYWPLARLKERSAKVLLRLVNEKVPLFLLVAASSMLTYIVHAQGRAFHNYSAEARFANALSSYLMYVGKTVWPSGLCIYYPHPGENINWLLAGSGGVLLAAITVLCLRVALSYPPLIVGWFWFVGTLIPVIGIVPIDGNSMADRYAYVPLIGLFVMFAWGMFGIGQSSPVRRRAFEGAGIVVVVAFAACTWHQTGYWRNSRVVFEHALSVTQHNEFAEAGLGDALLQEGNLPAAVDHLNRVVDANAASSEVLNSLGVALIRLRRADAAIQPLQEAVKRMPRNATYRCTLAEALLQQEGVDAAYRQYQVALELDPDLPCANVGIGWIQLGRSQPQAALAALGRAVRANPNDGDARHRLGVALLRQGRLEEGAEHLIQAVRLAPGAEPRFNCGMAFLRLGRLAEAELLFRQVLAEEPGHMDARSYLGLCLGLQGKSKEAINHLQVALKANPDNPLSLHHLAVALAREGRLEEAVAAAERAHAIDPNQPGLKQMIDQLKSDLAATHTK